MLSLKLNSIFKLKLLNIFFFFLLQNNKRIYSTTHCSWFFIYFLKELGLRFNTFNFIEHSTSFANQLNLKKLLFFKNNCSNPFLLYKSINASSATIKKNTVISNYDPYNIFFYYNSFIKNVNKDSSKYYSNFYQNNLYFIKFFIFKYLSTFLIDKSFFISLQKNNFDIVEKSLLYKMLVKKTKRLGFLKEISFKTKAFINLILTSLYNKDVILLKNGVKGILEKLHFKKHKKFLYNLKVLLKSIAYIFFFKFKCLGLYIQIKGKIGLGGSSKKKKFVFKLGSFSFTNKTQRLTYVKDSIRTYSGVLGFETYLTYK